MLGDDITPLIVKDLPHDSEFAQRLQLTLREKLPSIARGNLKAIK